MKNHGGRALCLGHFSIAGVGRFWRAPKANSLVDSFAAVLDHALTRYQGRIKPEEAKALLITAYIQRSKLSFVA
jgi:hypothetical protein